MSILILTTLFMLANTTLYLIIIIIIYIWYEHIPNGVIESDDIKILWDFNIQCDHVIESRRPDIVVVLKKERECKIMDIAVPGDCRICEKKTREDRKV